MDPPPRVWCHGAVKATRCAALCAALIFAAACDEAPTAPTVDVTGAACQSCARVADYGVFEQPLSTARLAGDVLEFTLAACRFTATLPEAPAQTVAGVAACRPAPADPEISGTWTMSRR
jgi:hypothetical protein